MTSDKYTDVVPRYKLTASLMLPLADGVFSPGGYEEGPFEWHRWGSFRNDPKGTNDRLPEKARNFFFSEEQRTGKKRLRFLTFNPKSQPWIRFPGAYYGNSRQPDEIFLNHIEELLYPGMALLRSTIGHSTESEHTVNQALLDPPTRRWLGLPDGLRRYSKECVRQRSDEKLVVDLTGVEASRSGYRGAVPFSVDAGEVIELDLGPSQQDLGPVTIGILHLSIDEHVLDTGAYKHVKEVWGSTLLKDLLVCLSQDLSVLGSVSREKGIYVLARQTHKGDLIPDKSFLVPEGEPNYFLNRAWITSTYFGNGRNSGGANAPGGHFLLQVPPCCLFSNEREIQEKQGELQEEEAQSRLIQLAALARSEEDVEICNLTGRVLAASVLRGTAILDRGSEGSLSDSALCAEQELAFRTITSEAVRNMRSYWLQGALLGVIQHQLIKRFASRLGLAGGRIDEGSLRKQYEEWLVFNNSAWWTELTYSRPPTDKLLRILRRAFRLPAVHGELASDFETYTAFAERRHDLSTQRKLNLLQVLGVGVVVFGLGGVAAEISARTSDEPVWFSVVFWGGVAVVATAVIAFVTFAGDLVKRERAKRRPR